MHFIVLMPTAHRSDAYRSSFRCLPPRSEDIARWIPTNTVTIESRDRADFAIDSRSATVLPPVDRLAGLLGRLVPVGPATYSQAALHRNSAFSIPAIPAPILPASGPTGSAPAIPVPG